MEATIVIPVWNDIRIKDCLESIDEDVEVVVSLAPPTPGMKRFLERKGIEYCESSKGNLGKAYNKGIEASSKDKIILMDSDCVFQKDCIKKLISGLKGNLLCKGKIEFKHTNFFESLVAGVRSFLENGENAYSPPLALKKGLKNEVGGYIFDEKIKWVEDGELNARCKKYKVEINHDPEAKVLHDSIGPFNYLKNTFRYGRGQRRGVLKGTLYGEENIKRDILSKISSLFSPDSLNLIKEISKEKGIFPMFYFLIWKLTFIYGYYYQALRGD
ncbi:MAG: glycosyltransferase [Candidatus Aenigmatarchaeota archaeon]